MSYRIGEMARLLGTSEHTLRYYEKIGLVVPKRDPNKNRYYTDEDANWMRFILHMKQTGMSLEDLKRYIDLFGKGQGGIDELLQILYKHQEEVQAKLRIYQENLKLVEKKIRFYEESRRSGNGKNLFHHFVEEAEC